MHSTSTHQTLLAKLFPRFRVDGRNTYVPTTTSIPHTTDSEQDFVAKYILQRTLLTCKARDDVYDVLIALAPLLFKGSSGELVFPIAAPAKGNLVIGWGTVAPQQSDYAAYDVPIVAANKQIGRLQIWETVKQDRQNSNSATFVAEIAQMIGHCIEQLRGR